MNTHREIKTAVVFMIALFWLAWYLDGVKVNAITDTDQQNIVIKYQKYLLLQVQMQNAQQSVQNSVLDYNKAVADLIKKEKQPEGTTVRVNLDNSTIEFVPPPVKEEPKK